MINKFTALFEATTSLASDLDLDKILPKALKILQAILKNDNAAVLLLEHPGSRNLRVRAAVGYRRDVISSLRLPIGKGITGWVMETGEIANVPDVTVDPRYLEGVSGARSELAVPLVCEGRRIGVLDIESKAKGGFQNEEDIQILQIFASHLASAIANAERYEQIRRQNRNLGLAARVGRIATSTLNLAELLDRSLKLIRRELGCSHLDFFLLDPDGQMLSLKAAATTVGAASAEKGYRQAVTVGLVGAAVQSRKPVVVADVRKDRRYLEGTRTTRSEAAVPVSFGGEILGVLNAESPKTGAFGRSEVGLLESIGSTLAAAVRNSLLYAEIIEYSDRVSEAQTFARRLNSTLSLDEILSTAAERLPSLTHARRVAVFLYDEEWLILDLAAHNFVGFEGRVRIPATTESELTRCLRVNSSLNESEPERPGRSGEPHPAYPNGPFMSVLLKLGERVVGLIVLSERIEGGVFSDHDFHFANTVGEHLAVAIANAGLYEKTLRLSQTDGLTGLLVHRAFYEALDREVTRARESRRPFSVLMGDLDRFKSINDRYGHPFGDRILAHAARVIRETIRPQDIAARYGGEEFCVILPETDRRGALTVAERIRSRLERETIRTDDGALQVTISFGVAEFDARTDRAGLIGGVDQALYRAKRSGRNRSEVWTGSTSS